MKLRKVLSVFAIALLPILGGVASSGCTVEEDPVTQSDNITQLSDYELNVAAANQIWPGEVAIVNPEDAWTALVKVGDQTIPAPTHLFGNVLNVVPYSNQDNQSDAAGDAFARGDQEIAKIYKPGETGIALKMHRPTERTVDLNDADPTTMKEDFKLQDTHIEFVVGVEKAEHGSAGAITLNNPQGYEDGRFGDPGYPMIFLRQTYPEYITGDLKAEYQKNILASAVMYNAVTNFPGDYNGGDPLAANSVEAMRTYTEQGVKAIAGDAEAVAWFQDAANLIYCAEFAFIALSGGVVDPLTASNMVPRVGQATWDAFVAEVEKHNAGVDEFQQSGSISAENTSRFLSMNENKRAGLIRIQLPSDSLQPMSAHSPDEAADSQKLALRWMTMADIVQQFMRTHIPRETLGEQLAPVQGAVLAKMKPGLLETMGMDQMPEDDPRRQAVEALFAQIVQVVGTPHGSYEEFQAAIAPLTAQAAQITGPRDNTGTGAFVPPSLYHVVAQGHHTGGLLGMQYEGHGVPVEAVNLKQGAADEPVTDTDDIASEVSCQAQCGGQAAGGCWCDSLCTQYGDCCDDYGQVCQ